MTIAPPGTVIPVGPKANRSAPPRVLRPPEESAPDNPDRSGTSGQPAQRTRRRQSDGIPIPAHNALQAPSSTASSSSAALAGWWNR